ncbi:MAG: PAS domain S-box protein [Desulfobacterales bacterium]|jgi:histidine kinase
MMFKVFKNIRRRMVLKLIFIVGMMLFLTIFSWSYYNINYQKKDLMDNIVSGADQLTNTIKLGAHFAMMLNSRDDINQIIRNISKQPKIENIRIYNKNGRIKFSNKTAEVDRVTNIKAEACDICHRSDPPLTEIDLDDRTRIFNSPEGYRLLGIISPICNEPGCSSDACHVHPEGKKVLGALDVVVSLQQSDKEIALAKKRIIGLAGFVFLVTATIIFLFVLRFINRPIKELIAGTRRMAKGEYTSKVEITRDDEMGQLALAINQMGQEIGQKQAELNKQRDEYQTLFERVPCLITVQDRNLRLLRYNREFALKFEPQPGDYCFHAYKGRSQKCEDCPVERTFADGLPHIGEETGINRDGSTVCWIVRTSPIKNDAGEIVAAMEMSLDITHNRQLEDELRKSEKKYRDIFNHMPNPVFVLDWETLEIIDCNESVTADYGYSKDDLIARSFLDLFESSAKGFYASEMRTSTVLNQIKHLNKDGKSLVVNIRVSPSDYPGKKVLLVTTSDITQRLEAEQQLIQASKMATLGEMATGIAHELNQPLSVIKTASSFCIKKIDSKKEIDPKTLSTMLFKIDNNTDRASRIINHMRQFARKNDMALGRIQVNDVLKNAFDIFSQQLKLRGIEVVWDIQGDLPAIKAEAGRLEQVFINLLINARDAIEDRWGSQELPDSEKRITITTRTAKKTVIVEVCDTGVGIPKAVLDKIFEPFFTTKEVGKGTGLGLSISYGIIKECGGSIQARSQKDHGACFIINFPIPD